MILLSLLTLDFYKSNLSTLSMYLYLTCLGGYRERETPGPIPNPEAKPLIADNTRPFRIGNVGRCLVGQIYFFITNSQNLFI